MSFQSYPGLWHSTSTQDAEAGGLQAQGHPNNLVRPRLKKSKEIYGYNSVVENSSKACEALASILSITKGRIKVARDPSILFTQQTAKQPIKLGFSLNHMTQPKRDA